MSGPSQKMRNKNRDKFDEILDAMLELERRARLMSQMHSSSGDERLSRKALYVAAVKFAAVIDDEDTEVVLAAIKKVA